MLQREFLDSIARSVISRSEAEIRRRASSAKVSRKSGENGLDGERAAAARVIHRETAKCRISAMRQSRDPSPKLPKQ